METDGSPDFLPVMPNSCVIPMVIGLRRTLNPVIPDAIRYPVFSMTSILT